MWGEGKWSAPRTQDSNLQPTARLANQLIPDLSPVFASRSLPLEETADSAPLSSHPDTASATRDSIDFPLIVQFRNSLARPSRNTTRERPSVASRLCECSDPSSPDPFCRCRAFDEVFIIDAFRTQLESRLLANKLADAPLDPDWLFRILRLAFPELDTTRPFRSPPLTSELESALSRHFPPHIRASSRIESSLLHYDQCRTSEPPTSTSASRYTPTVTVLENDSRFNNMMKHLADCLRSIDSSVTLLHPVSSSSSSPSSEEPPVRELSELIDLMSDRVVEEIILDAQAMRGFSRESTIEFLSIVFRRKPNALKFWRSKNRFDWFHPFGKMLFEEEEEADDNPGRFREVCGEIQKNMMCELESRMIQNDDIDFGHSYCFNYSTKKWFWNDIEIDLNSIHSMPETPYFWNDEEEGEERHAIHSSCPFVFSGAPATMVTLPGLALIPLMDFSSSLDVFCNLQSAYSECILFVGAKRVKVEYRFLYLWFRVRENEFLSIDGRNTDSLPNEIDLGDVYSFVRNRSIGVDSVCPPETELSSFCRSYQKTARTVLRIPGLSPDVVFYSILPFFSESQAFFQAVPNVYLHDLTHTSLRSGFIANPFWSHLHTLFLDGDDGENTVESRLKSELTHFESRHCESLIELVEVFTALLSSSRKWTEQSALLHPSIISLLFTNAVLLLRSGTCRRLLSNTYRLVHSQIMDVCSTHSINVSLVWNLYRRWRTRDSRLAAILSAEMFAQDYVFSTTSLPLLPRFLEGLLADCEDDSFLVTILRRLFVVKPRSWLVSCDEDGSMYTLAPVPSFVVLHSILCASLEYLSRNEQDESFGCCLTSFLESFESPLWYRLHECVSISLCLDELLCEIAFGLRKWNTWRVNIRLMDYCLMNLSRRVDFLCDRYHDRIPLIFREYVRSSMTPEAAVVPLNRYFAILGNRKTAADTLFLIEIVREILSCRFTCQSQFCDGLVALILKGGDALVRVCRTEILVSPLIASLRQSLEKWQHPAFDKRSRMTNRVKCLQLICGEDFMAVFGDTLFEVVRLVENEVLFHEQSDHLLNRSGGQCRLKHPLAVLKVANDWLSVRSQFYRSDLCLFALLSCNDCLRTDDLAPSMKSHHGAWKLPERSLEELIELCRLATATPQPEDLLDECKRTCLIVRLIGCMLSLRSSMLELFLDLRISLSRIPKNVIGNEYLEAVQETRALAIRFSDLTRSIIFHLTELPLWMIHLTEQTSLAVFSLLLACFRVTRIRVLKEYASPTLLSSYGPEIARSILSRLISLDLSNASSAFSYALRRSFLRYGVDCLTLMKMCSAEFLDQHRLEGVDLWDSFAKIVERDLFVSWSVQESICHVLCHFGEERRLVQFTPRAIVALARMYKKSEDHRPSFLLKFPFSVLLRCDEVSVRTLLNDTILGIEWVKSSALSNGIGFLVNRLVRIENERFAKRVLFTEILSLLRLGSILLRHFLLLNTGQVSEIERFVRMMFIQERSRSRSENREILRGALDAMISEDDLGFSSFKFVPVSSSDLDQSPSLGRDHQQTSRSRPECVLARELWDLLSSSDDGEEEEIPATLIAMFAPFQVSLVDNESHEVEETVSESSTSFTWSADSFSLTTGLESVLNSYQQQPPSSVPPVVASFPTVDQAENSVFTFDSSSFSSSSPSSPTLLSTTPSTPENASVFVFESSLPLPSQTSSSASTSSREEESNRFVEPEKRRKVYRRRH